jgi:hypothetical protein
MKIQEAAQAGEVDPNANDEDDKLKTISQVVTQLAEDQREVQIDFKCSKIQQAYFLCAVADEEAFGKNGEAVSFDDARCSC